jgi:1,4-dihydroxy-2-naphthoate octaprenyltransferase
MKYINALRAPFALVSFFNFLVLWLALGAPLNGMFYFALTGVVLAHLSANLWNDFFDRKADELNKTPTPFSGGSRVLQTGQITPRAFLIFVIILSALSIAIGAGLWAYTGFSPFLPLVAAFTGLLSYFYTANPLRLVYRGWGEPVIFLTFGPLVLLGIAALLKTPLTLQAVLISCILGILSARLLFVNEFPDFPWDKAAGKNTWVVRLSPEKAKILLPVFSLMCIALSFYILPQLWWAALAFIFITVEILTALSGPFPLKSALAQLQHLLAVFLLLLYLS